VAKENKSGLYKIFKWLGGSALFLFLLFIILGFLVGADINKKIKKCNEGGKEECQNLIDSYPTSLDEEDIAEITNPLFNDLYQNYLLIKKIELDSLKESEKPKKREALYLTNPELAECTDILRNSLTYPDSLITLNSPGNQLVYGLISYQAINSNKERFRNKFDCGTLKNVED
tara:strand:- start:32 stop:550 length:519 start_codon:yes stop_codon:yes gene_type:complete